MGDLTQEENERVCQKMRWALAERFDGNITSLAKAMERKQPSLSEILNGKGGASLETARRLAKILGIEVWELLGRDRSEPRTDDPYPNRAAAVGAARMLGYSEEAIQRVLADNSGQPDQTSEAWLEEIRVQQRKVERGLPPADGRVAHELDRPPPGARKRGKK